MELTAKQRRHLRALAHHLKPVVQVGTSGVSDALLLKVEDELENHELIKVKVSKESPVGAAEAGAIFVERTRAGLAQIIGKTLILYRPRKEKPTIRLPKEVD